MKETNKERGYVDNINLPNGFISIDLSKNKIAKNIFKSVKKYFPKKPKYHYPKVIPFIDGYHTFQPLIKFDEAINFNNIYYIDDIINKIPNLYQIFELPEVHNLISKYYASEFDSGYMIYHVSAYRSFPDKLDATGYQNWHKDNFPPYCKKLLIYLTDIENEEDGASQIKKDEAISSILGPKGTAFFFDMNTLHRGKKISKISKKSYRDIIYFSICPYNDRNIVPIQSLGTDVVFPHNLEKALVNGVKKQYANLGKSYLNISHEINGINIGGGSFTKNNWINFDLRDSTGNALNQYKFDLMRHEPFPIESSTISYIYSSHCLEHLDTNTNIYIFKEIKRILKKGGKFLLKLPNFELVIEKYLQKDYDFFVNNWGITALEKNWLMNNVNPSLENYFIMIFASYSTFGSTTLYEINDTPYYYGPPKISKEELNHAINTMSVTKLSKYLVNKIPLDAHQKGHINAFTENSIINYTKKAGLNLILTSINPDSNDFDEFKSELGEEEVNKMKNISKYYIIEK